MISKTVTFLAALGLVAASSLFAQDAQSPPPIYYGPYEQAHIEQFTGEWTRNDGGYRIVITIVEGELQAKYFNPEPINVESAVAEPFEDMIGLTIVLRDAGYDGSTYRLQYLPQYRLLVGTYAMPGQEPGQVYFSK